MKRHYDNPNVIRINKTNIRMALIIVIAMFCFIGYAEAQDCYNKNRSNGVTAMRSQDYDKAIRWFEVAQKCPDKPENNDLQSKINECRNLKQQMSLAAEEQKKKYEKEERDRKEAVKREKEEQKERREETKKKPEETKSLSTERGSASGSANNNMLIQISDDFNGNSINSQYWTATGDVKVSNGNLIISQSQTDKDMSITSKNLAVPTSKKIVIERRFLNHKAKNFYYGGFTINLNGNLNEFVGINYFYGDYEKWYGTKISYKLDGKENRIDLRSTEFDTWITDKVIVDFAAGTMTYYLDNNVVATKTVPGLASKNVSFYNVRFHSYGWWTGHYSNIDYIRISDVVGEPTTTYQSNVYVPTVDTRYWDLIYSQNANEKKYCDGVYGNNVECFSTYVKINRNKFRISFDFEAMESTKPEGQYVMVLSMGWRVFGVYLTKEGDIKVTTNNQSNKYSTGLKYNMGESTIIEAEFDNGTLIINGVKIQNVDLNRTDGDNNLSSINYGNGTAFHGYIKNVRVYNGK